MGRLTAIFGLLTGILLIPLSLAGPTAWLLLPAHLFFTVLTSVAALGHGLTGQPVQARLWGFGYIFATVSMVAALELGSEVNHSAYWVAPWMAAVIWGWIPPTIALLSAWFGDLRRAFLSDRAVKHRKLRAR